jgi:hypothetical protein
MILFPQKCLVQMLIWLVRAEIQSQAIEFAERNLLLVQGNLLWPFLYIELLPLTNYCKDCLVGPDLDIAKENSTKTLWI